MSSRYMQPLRILVQFCFLAMVALIGFNFHTFVEAVSTDSYHATAVRPEAIDAFLPISGLLGTTLWLKGGGINSIHPAAVTIFLSAVLVSVVMRRSFCSWICPIAAISEWLWKGGFRILHGNPRLPVWLDRVLRCIKYLLLVFFIYSIVFAMSSDALSQFIQSDYHMIADVRLLHFFQHISPVAFCILLMLVLLSFVLKNPFCRYLCPYGALLGLGAVISPLRVSRDIDRCVSCGVCSQVCPSHIDVMHKTDVASPECIACWRCISHCRFNEALSMKIIRRSAVPGFIFAAFVVMLFWGGTVVGKLNGNWYSSLTITEYARLLGK